MNSEVEILRVVISSNISGSLLCEKLFRWTYTNEQVVVSKLCQVLIQIAVEFDDGGVQFASFEIPDTGKSPVSESRSAIYDESRNLNLALSIKDDIITAIFYVIHAEKRLESHGEYIENKSHMISQDFCNKYSEFHQSKRSILEGIAKEEIPMPQDMSSRFAEFSDTITQLVA